MKYTSLEDYKLIPALPRISEQNAHVFLKSSLSFILEMPSKKKQFEVLNVLKKHLKNPAFKSLYIENFNWKEDKSVLKFGVELLSEISDLGFNVNALFPNVRYEAYLHQAPFKVHQKLDDLSIREITLKEFKQLVVKTFEKNVHYEVAKSPILDAGFLKMFEKRGLNEKYLKAFPINEIAAQFSKNHHWLLFKNQNLKYVKSLWTINYSDSKSILEIFSKHEIDWFLHMPCPSDEKEMLIIQIATEFKQKFQEGFLKKSLKKEVSKVQPKTRF